MRRKRATRRARPIIVIADKIQATVIDNDLIHGMAMR